MNKTVIGFDMDGVLLDSDDFTPGGWIVEAFMKTLRDFGIPQTEENAKRLYISSLRREGEKFCAEFGIPDIETLWAQRERNYLSGKLAAIQSGQVTLFPDVAALEGLAREYPLAIVSNSPQEIVDLVVKRFSLDRLFRLWIGRGHNWDELATAKPAPDQLLRMKKEIGADRGYYVGDQPDDVTAARAAGLVPILIDRKGKNGDIKSLDELSEFIARYECALQNAERFNR